jgi:nucleoside-diphosphate-sugar epimerase
MRKDLILLTGATGFLGGAVAADLLQQDRWNHVLLLVRAPSVRAARERVVQSVQRFEIRPALLDRIRDDQIICGGLGDLPSHHALPRLGDVARVLNCAAITSFGRNPKTWSTNVDETVAFARKVARLPRLERYVHVSTAMICGTHPPLIVREDAYPARGVQHLVPYTDSKAEAERILRKEMADVPLVVVRPSIIVGHTRLGTTPSSSIFWAFRIGDSLHITTSDVDGVIDVVPVDYAAGAVEHLLFKQTLNHRTYHVSAGQDSSSSFREIGRAFARALGEKRPGDYRRASLADLAAMKDQFPDRLGPCNPRFVLKALRLYGAFAALNAVFDNSRLLGEHFEPPPRFADYVGVCVQTSRHIPPTEQMMIDFE